jgi:cytochrome c-type biogenesis protein CcmH
MKAALGFSCAALAGVALIAYIGASKPAGAGSSAGPVASEAAANRLTIAEADSMLSTVGAGTPEAQTGAQDTREPAVADKIAAVDQHGGGSMEGAIAGLEQRLAAKGGSDADWDLLAKSYEFLGRKADAALARNRQLPAGAGAADANAAAAASAPTAARDAKVSVDGEVILADTLRDKVPAGLTLFIVAKSVNSPGPPVAILRTTTDAWPVHFRLDDTQAMMPQHKLSTAGPVTIEARTSKSGQAMPERGDFQGVTTQLDPAAGKPIRIVIERVIG